MKRKELIESVAIKTGYTQKDVAVVIDALDGVIEEVVTKEDSVKLGCYKLYGIEKKSGVARNPKTGEAVNVAARIVARSEEAPSFTKRMKESK